MTAPLTPSQIAIVKATVPVLREHGEAITKVFYDTMIAENPELRNVFNKTSQTTGRQPRALAGAVLAYATYIDDLSKLSAAVEKIAHKHVSLQIAPAQYGIVGKYLIAAIGSVLGDAATPEIVDAWRAAYGALAAVFIGVEAQMYKANAADSWVGWRKFRILRKVPESNVITSFYLAPIDSVPLPSFYPGQYISLQITVPQLGHLQSRQYSLSTGPREDGEYYRISVKKDMGDDVGIAGTISNLLHDNYVEGDEVEVSHPQGEFFVDPYDATKDGAPIVLVSAGVGATPMMSILASLAPEQQPVSAQAPVKRPISWIHAARSSVAQPFAEDVRRICLANKNVTAHVFLRTLGPDDQAGVDYAFADTRIDLAKLDQDQDLHISNRAAEYYICGPENFMVDVRKTLLDLGVDSARVHLELFGVGEVTVE